MIQGGEPLNRRPYSLKDLAWYFLVLGSTGFGGPIALVGYMERDLVDERKWFTREEFLRGLALSQLAPGPLAAQLAIYIGYLKGGVLGSTVIGVAFILPSFLIVVALGMVYVTYGGLAWIQAVFYGIGASVIAIIARSAYKLTRTTLKSKVLLWFVFVVMAVVTAYKEEEIVWLFILCGIISLAVATWKTFSAGKAFLLIPPAASIFQKALSSDAESMTSVFLFFAKAGAFVFGSGLAIVPFLYGGVVQEHQWLTEREFVDSVAVAMITPGPVVITVGFIGYLIAGLPGAIVSSLGVFLPVYLFVVIPAPYFERHANNRALIAFVEGVTAAATGAIAGAVVVLATRAIVDIPTLIIAMTSFVLLFRTRLKEPVIILLAGFCGYLIG